MLLSDPPPGDDVSPETSDPSDVRFFSLEEANRTLPLVRRIVQDITALYRELDPLSRRYRTLGAAERRDARHAELRAEVDEGLERLEALVRELHDLGCRFKGFEEGLVDWYSLYASRPVFLCWKLGEPEIRWWHQVDAGYAGRQRILPSQREAFRAERVAGR